MSNVTAQIAAKIECHCRNVENDHNTGENSQSALTLNFHDTAQR